MNYPIDIIGNILQFIPNEEIEEVITVKSTLPFVYLRYCYLDFIKYDLYSNINPEIINLFDERHTKTILKNVKNENYIKCTHK